MNKHFSLKTSLVVAAMLMLPLAQATTMTKVDYKAGKTRISADYKADKTACASLAANACSAVFNLTCGSCASVRTTSRRNCGPSNHPYPNSSASKGATHTPGRPVWYL